MRFSGLSRQTLHQYTLLGLICEAARTEGDHRLYREDVLERLERIQALRRAGRTIPEICRMLGRAGEGWAFSPAGAERGA